MCKLDSTVLGEGPVLSFNSYRNEHSGFRKAGNSSSDELSAA